MEDTHITSVRSEILSHLRKGGIHTHWQLPFIEPILLVGLHLLPGLPCLPSPQLSFDPTVPYRSLRRCDYRPVGCYSCHHCYRYQLFSVGRSSFPLRVIGVDGQEKCPNWLFFFLLDSLKLVSILVVWWSSLPCIVVVNKLAVLVWSISVTALPWLSVVWLVMLLVICKEPTDWAAGNGKSSLQLFDRISHILIFFGNFPGWWLFSVVSPSSLVCSASFYLWPNLRRPLSVGMLKPLLLLPNVLVTMRLLVPVWSRCLICGNPSKNFVSGASSWLPAPWICKMALLVLSVHWLLLLLASR